MAEKSDFVNTRSPSDLASGSALNTDPVQGLSCSIQESFACSIGGRSDEPFAYKLRSGRLHASTYPLHRAIHLIRQRPSVLESGRCEARLLIMFGIEA